MKKMFLMPMTMILPAADIGELQTKRDDNDAASCVELGILYGKGEA